MGALLQLPSRTYVAKLSRVLASGIEFRIAGTLDGFIDLYVKSGVGQCTYNLTCDDARRLIAALNSTVADIQANCLFDRDALLVREPEI